MRLSLPNFLIAVVATLAGITGSAHAKTHVPAYVAAAINDPARKDDRADDTRRQMAAVMTFTGVKPGQKVLELVPGHGYWTRVFSRIVGTKGHVYTVWPRETMKFAAKSLANWKTLVKSTYSNVSLLEQPAADLSVPGHVDVAFTCQNYHDYHDKFMGPVDMVAFDKKVFAALKPGGVFIIIDHRAPAGSGVADTGTLHRIDPAVVKKEMAAAGFHFVGSSNALHNPKDPLTKRVFDPSIRGHTDQFIFKFRKPAK